MRVFSSMVYRKAGWGANREFRGPLPRQSVLGMSTIGRRSSHVEKNNPAVFLPGKSSIDHGGVHYRASVIFHCTLKTRVSLSLATWPSERVPSTESRRVFLPGCSESVTVSNVPGEGWND